MTTVDMQQLAPGIYFVKADNGKDIQVKRVVVK